jgi:hypothetical protein
MQVVLASYTMIAFAAVESLVVRMLSTAPYNLRKSTKLKSGTTRGPLVSAVRCVRMSGRAHERAWVGNR